MELADGVTAWLERTLADHGAAGVAGTGPFYVGVNGPQGAGKSTLCAAMAEHLGRAGTPALAISVDDFYLTRADQVALSGRHPRNPFLAQRGYPGTHDVDLGVRTLDELAVIPRYDKGAHGGLGDRCPREQWTEVKQIPAVVFLEGWMLGFPAVPSAGVIDPHFKAVNRLLENYRPWDERLDAWIQLTVSDPEVVFRWRLQAEQERRARGEGALSDEAITDYVGRFMPAYRIWGPAFLAKKWDIPGYRVSLDEERRPTGAPFQWEV